MQVAKPKTVMNILKQAYGDNKAAVDDELVQVVLDPGLQVPPWFCLSRSQLSILIWTAMSCSMTQQGQLQALSAAAACNTCLSLLQSLCQLLHHLC